MHYNCIAFLAKFNQCSNFQEADTPSQLNFQPNQLFSLVLSINPSRNAKLYEII